MIGTLRRYENGIGSGPPAPAAGVTVAFFTDRTLGDESHEGPLRHLVEELHCNLETREG